ncbi:MAG TPA: ABC transporter ATP-binding protein [Anaerolineaceae bacterium]
MTAKMPADGMVFEVRDASFAYDGRQAALDRVSLAVRRGERVTVVGANGSGKSTLLRLLDGLAFPSAGTVCAFGQELSEAAFRDDAFNFAFRRRVGLVFQDSDVQLFSPSVWDEVAFAPLQLGLHAEEVTERVEQALAELRIGALRDRPPHRLSGGEKKRVALASVLSLDPEVWLLDEPSAGLDPRSEAWLEDFILGQAESGKTMVITTHDLELASAVSDRVTLFSEDHRLVGEGRPDEILADRALLAACNLIHEHLHRHAGTAQPHRHPHLHDGEHDHHAV